MKDVRRVATKFARENVWEKKGFEGRKMSIAKIYHRLVRVAVYISDRFIDTIYLSLIT